MKILDNIKAFVQQELNKNVDDCSLNKLSVWNNTIVDRPANSPFLLSPEKVYRTEQLKEYLKEKIRNSPLKLKEALLSLASTIQKNNSVVTSISNVELYMKRIYEELLYIITLYYNVVNTSGACSKVNEIFSEFGINPDEKEQFLCIFGGQDITKCFNDENIKRQFNKISFVKFTGNDVERMRLVDTFSASDIMQFLYSLFKWSVSDRGGYYIDFIESCKKMIGDEELQGKCTGLANSLGLTWKQICETITNVFGNMATFTSIAIRTCIPSCLQKYDNCIYIFSSNCTEGRCTSLVDSLLSAGCNNNMDEQTTINIVPKCCEMEQSNRDTQCKEFFNLLPTSSRITGPDNNLYYKTSSTKIDWNKIIAGKLLLLLGKEKFDKILASPLKDGSFSVLTLSCPR